MSNLKAAIVDFIKGRLNEVGQEMLDPKPVALPIGYKNPPSLEERIRSMISVTLSRQAAEAGAESFDEANDFDVADGDDEKFPDEDDKFAVNDPNVKNAFEREEPVVRERINKAKETEKKTLMSKKQKPADVPAEPDEADGAV